MQLDHKLLASVLAGALVLSGAAFAQDTAAPNTNQNQSQTSTKRHKKDAKQSGAEGTQSTQTGSSTGSSLAAADRHFVTKAAEGGLMEVELGNLAQQKASNDAVKQFGQRMVTDHSKANDELKSLAQQKGVTLPTEMDAKGKAMKARLEKLSGEAFDKAYMKDMVTDHTKDVSEFEKASNTAKDNDVKTWAGKTLPTLQDHLKQAKEVHGQVAGEKGGKEKAKADKPEKSQ